MKGAQAAELAERLRLRLLTAFHLGRFKSGQRLPSVRQLAKEWSADPRQIMRAYHQLEDEGLVEVRKRSGVYLAITGDLPMDGARPDLVGWLTDVAMQARARRVSLPRTAELVARALDGRIIHCVCIESALDPMVALDTELQRDYGFRVRRLRVEPDVNTSVGSPTSIAESASVEAPTTESGAPPIDLVIATAFHTRTATALASRLQVPRLILAVNPRWVEGLTGPMQREGLVVVVMDPRSCGRFRTMLGVEPEDPRFDCRVADDPADVQRILDEAGPAAVYATGAARARLEDHDRPLLNRLLLPEAPLLDVDSARRLVSHAIRLNLADDG